MSFIRKRTSEKLELKGSPAQLSLSTMYGKDSLIHNKCYSNIRVWVYDSHDSITILTLYTYEVVPVNQSHIATPEMTDH